MDIDIRAELEKAFALDDAARASYEEWQRCHEARACNDDGQPEPQPRIIRKTYQPPPETQVTTMDAATQARWDEWADAKIQRGIEVVARVIGEEVYKLLEEQRAEIGALRADLTLLQSITRGDVKQLKGKTSDAA